MRAAGFTLWRDHTGWASMGPLAAIPRIPKLLAIDVAHRVSHSRRSKPDLVVLVDFGVFNLRLAMTLRRLRYARAGAGSLSVRARGSTTRRRRARVARGRRADDGVRASSTGSTRASGLPVIYFGHPLAGRYTHASAACARRPPTAGRSRCCPAAAAANCGTTCPRLRRRIAMLQRAAAEAARRVRRGRRRAERDASQRAIARERLTGVTVVRGVARRARRCRRRVGRVGYGRTGDGAFRRAGGRVLHHHADAGQTRAAR